jgi:hypothetical protein
MAIKDQLESFIGDIFESNPGNMISKQDILDTEGAEGLPGNAQKILAQIPDQDYSENNLINEVNNVIKQKNMTEAVGGLLQTPVIAK